MCSFPVFLFPCLSSLLYSYSSRYRRKQSILVVMLDLYRVLLFSKSRDSSVGIALGYGLDDWGSRVRFPAGAGNFSLHHRVQNGSGAHPTSYPMGTKGPFPWRLGCEADLSHLSSAEVKECMELYLHSPNTPSWRGAQLK
jgi:hypothetical protein